MPQAKKQPTILMLDDDNEDIYLTRRAFCNYRKDLIFNGVHCSSKMFDYLNCRGEFKENGPEHSPDIILLDINLPKENGFAILEKLRTDKQFGHIPVTMLTTSIACRDIQTAYSLGASSYICKSVSSKGMQEVAQQFCDYWFGFAKLPLAS